MQYTIEELRQELFSKVFGVYRIFQDYFGEDKTDLQNIPDDSNIVDSLENQDCEYVEGEEGKWNVSAAQKRRIKEYWSTLKPYIYVYWPEVTVTNEHNRSIVIQDLYAKVELTLEGRIPYENRGFQLVRTTFPQIQFNSGYLHSHIPNFSGVPHFSNPCLGTGPIKDTIMSLMNDCDDMTWMMFCRELAMYVTVESLRGIPYNKLEEVGQKTNSILYGYEDYTHSSYKKLMEFYEEGTKEEFLKMIENFTAYYLANGHLKLGFNSRTFESGMPYFDFIIDISNSFIDWYNKHGDKSCINRLYAKKVLVACQVAGGRFYRAENSPMATAAYEGSNILTFKGEQKNLHIIHEESNTEVTLLLNQSIAMYILEHILNIINYRFRNEHNNRYRGEGASTEEPTPPTYQAVLYL